MNALWRENMLIAFLGNHLLKAKYLLFVNMIQIGGRYVSVGCCLYTDQSIGSAESQSK